MFAYDPELAAATEKSPQSVAEVLQTLQTIEAICVEGDGLRWFNRLYREVTQSVAGLVNDTPPQLCNDGGAGGWLMAFHDPQWIAELDVQFARLYLKALHGRLTGGSCPGCWNAFFAVRDNALIARIQFALAGINAHINRDLAAAITATCAARNTVPQHGTPQYEDYTAINATLEALIETAKRELHVRLLGDALPEISRLEDTVAAWGTGAAREQAWRHAEALWQLRHLPHIAAGYLDGLDGLTTFGNKALLVPVPLQLA
jgi:uncharacterized protein DUF5995